jgi:hypothetical protein
MVDSNLTTGKRSEQIQSSDQAWVRDRFYSLFPTQKQAAEHLVFAQGTISNFLGCKPVDRDNFIKICTAIKIDDWQRLAQGQFLEAPTSAYPTGSIPVQSPYYVQRPGIDSLCHQEILHRGALIRIQASRQFGKSSLMARVLSHGELQANQRSLTLTLQQVDAADLKTPQAFLGWFCNILTHYLDLPDLSADYQRWSGAIGAKSACLSCFEKHILPGVQGSLTLGIDELDGILDYPEVCQTFFSLLRVMNEYSSQKDSWKGFRLVLAHAAGDIETIANLPVTQSPFNVGCILSLPAFSAVEIQALADRYQLNWGLEETELLMQHVGGLPFLVHLALYQLAAQNTTLEALLRERSWIDRI